MTRYLCTMKREKLPQRHFACINGSFKMVTILAINEATQTSLLSPFRPCQVFSILTKGSNASYGNIRLTAAKCNNFNVLGYMRYLYEKYSSTLKYFFFTEYDLH